jgi:hypothetical protein
MLRVPEFTRHRGPPSRMIEKKTSAGGFVVRITRALYLVVTKNKLQGCGFLPLLLMLVTFLWIKEKACPPPPEPAKTAKTQEEITPSKVSADSEAAGKASGQPVVEYQIIPSQSNGDKKVIYVIPAKRPSDQALVDLAFDLRARYPSPSTVFEIVDSAVVIKQIEAFYAGDVTVTEEFVNAHEFAMLNRFLDPGVSDGFRWKLVGPDNRVIATFQNSSADIKLVERGRALAESEAEEARSA